MEKEEILISWLAEYDYCPRRFWLKAIERIEGENEYTAEGSTAHQYVDANRIEKRKEKIKVTGLGVRSAKYNLYGICDCVEFTISKEGGEIPFLGERCLVCPVEYKHGKVRNEREYNVQLTAQVLCLEEMYGVHISTGFIYYTSVRQRKEVKIEDNLRHYTLNVIESIRKYIQKGDPSPAEYMKRCHRCSVYDICSPKRVMVNKYMQELWRNVQS